MPSAIIAAPFSASASSSSSSVSATSPSSFSTPSTPAASWLRSRISFCAAAASAQRAGSSASAFSHLPLRSQPASFLRRPCGYPLCRPTFLRGATIPASLLLRTFLRSFGRACLRQICHQCGLPCGGQFPPCYGLPRSGFLGDGWCRLPSFGPDPIPTSFDCADDCGSASFAQFSFRLRRFRLDQRWRLRFAPDLGPSALLGFLHPPSSRSGEFPALAGGRSRRGGGGWFSATRQHGAQFGDLIVYACLLRFKTYDGGSDDFGS